MDSIELIEATTIAVGPDPDIAACIRIEFVDPTGQGFAVLLDSTEALDMVLQVTGMIARVRGYAAEDALCH